MSFIQNRREVITSNGENIHRDTRVTSGHYVHRSMSSVFSGLIVRIVYTASIIITVLLGLRFVLSIIGANPNNPIANFIYSASAPLIAPFVGLFNYTPHYGISTFDFESLIALVAYGIISWIIIALVNTGSDEFID